MFAAVLPWRQNEICSLSTDRSHWCFAGDPIKSLCPTTNNLSCRGNDTGVRNFTHSCFQELWNAVPSLCFSNNRNNGAVTLQSRSYGAVFSPLWPLYCRSNSDVNYPSSVPSVLADLMLLMFPICVAGNILTETRFAEMRFASHLKPPQICVGYPVSSKSHSTWFLLLSGLPKINQDTIWNVSKSGLRLTAWTRFAVCVQVHICWIFERKKKKRFVLPVFFWQRFDANLVIVHPF